MIVKTPTLLLTLAAAAIILAAVAGPRGASAAPLASPSLAPPSFAPPPTPSLGPPSEALPVASPEAVVPDEPRARKSPLVGLGLTVGVPAVGLLVGIPLAERGSAVGLGPLLVAASVIVGPSVGWFYAGHSGYGLATTGGRLTGGLILAWVALESWGRPLNSSGSALVWTGMAVIGASTLVDLVGVPAVIGRDNERIRATFVPTVHRGGGGLALAGSF
jgi:hypothetical protein